MEMKFLLILVLMVTWHHESTASSICNQLAEDANQPWKSPQLPKTIQPVRYRLHLSPNIYLTNTDFLGSVLLSFKVINATNTILVNQKDLDITSPLFSDTTCAKRVNISKTFKYNEYFVIQTNETMEASNCETTLRLRFRINLTIPSRNPSKTIYGFFRSTYINDITKKESSLFATRIHPYGSRYAFPSLDEPQFKAPVSIYTRLLKSFTVLSNMNIESSENLDKILKEVLFKQSPALSSHMVTFIISNFESKSNSLVSGKLNRVWARPDRLNQVDFALNATRVIENYLHRQFDIAYPFEKLDHFLLPARDFPPNAIANWGLITYKDSILLVDAAKTSYLDKLMALSVIANALAQNYFSNLVTSRSLDHAWLQSGLATFYEVRAVTEVYPSFTYKEHLFAEQLEMTMNWEATGISEALVSFPPSKDKPKDIYNGIHETKGAAILRMVESFMGPASFKRGIRRYLKNNTNKAVVTSDLWAALQQDVNDSSLNLETVMKNWVYQPGFPVVLVLPYQDNFIAIQKRFVTTDKVVNKDCRYTWHIPLKYRTKAGNEGLVWLRNSYDIFNVTLFSPGDWILFNHDTNGYYSVNYHQSLWQRLANQLNENYTVISEIARRKLLSDASRLAHTGEIGYDTLLNLARYASKERDATTWKIIFSFIDEIKYVTFHTTSFSRFQKYVLNLTSSFMNELGVNNQGSDNNKVLRPSIISLSCSASHRGCIENTTMIFKKWLRNETINAIPGNIMSLVYCIGVANSVLESEWNTVYERFTAASRSERRDLLYALSCSKNTTILKRLLWYAINDTRISSGDSLDAIAAIVKNPASEGCVFEWLQLNYTDTDTKVRSRLSDDMIYNIVLNVRTKELRDKVLSFLKTYPFGNSFLINTYDDLMKDQVRRTDRNLPSIVKWLDLNVP